MENIDVIAAVQEFSGLSSRDLSKSLKDSENFNVTYKTKNGVLKQIDMEKLASTLPLHLIAVILSSDRALHLTYVLRGIRLLHSFPDLAMRHTRLEQILFDDVKLSEQVMDLVILLLIVLAHQKQDNHLGASPFLHSVLVACTLHLLSVYVSSQWLELVHVLLAHPKVDVFMDVAFDSLHEDIRILSVKISTMTNEVKCKESGLQDAVRTVHLICQQSEASLQFLLSLCQQKPFRDRVLKNKKLCKNGGILCLARTVLKLSVPEWLQESSDVVAAVSRLKAKILSILLQLCESESESYLDEVASSPKSMQLGQFVILEILDLLKTAFRTERKQPGGHQRSNPMGFVLINALRMVDIFSDDSNFRSSVMTTTVPFLAQIFAISHEEFVSRWCSVNLSMIEVDTNPEYDPFSAAGVALLSIGDDGDCAESASFLLTGTHYPCPISFNGMPSATYAQLRTSCLVKIIANLHIFVPNICEEQERDLFLQEFHKYLINEKPDITKAASVCKNLSSLSEYAKSLIGNLLNDDDVQLLRSFTDTLRSRLPVGEVPLQDTHKGDGTTPTLSQKEDGTATREIQKFSLEVEAAPQISHCQELVPVTIANSRNPTGYQLGDFEVDQAKGTIIFSTNKSQEKEGANFENNAVEPKSNKMEDEKTEIARGDEKAPRKRKRNIMNETQINAIEAALLDEPEMQRNAVLLQSWSDRLSSQGSEITASQLKNWLNNRKAKLARVAKESRASVEDETPDKLSGAAGSQFYDSPESAGEETYVQTMRGDNQSS